MSWNPLNALLGLFSRDIGIDLGTANTLVLVRGKGIAINEPSVVAMNPKTKRVLAVGAEAKQMVGRTPANIVAVRPLRDGVISDFDVTEQMLRYFIKKVHERFAQIRRPRVLVGIPSGVTEVEKRAVRDATVNAGARWARLIEVLMGERTAEEIKIAVGSAYPVEGTRTVTFRGRDLLTGLPRSVEVGGDQIREALEPSAQQIVEAIKETIEETPPELVADVMDQGIVLAGGGALLAGLDRRVAEATQMPVHIADDPLTCVVRGTGRVLEDLDTLERVLVSEQFTRAPR